MIEGLFGPGEMKMASEERNREILARARLQGWEIAPIVQQFGTWAVTEWGVECLVEIYDIPAESLWSNADPRGWEGHMAAKMWPDLRDFLSALDAGRSYHRERLWPLTHLERHILSLIAAGKTEAEIGKEVGYSVGTVKIRLMEAKNKLKARNRTQAVAIALRLGLIE